MRHANRRRRGRGRSPRGSFAAVAARASAGARRAAASSGRATHSIAALGRDLVGRVAERVAPAERRPVNRARGRGGRPPLKRSVGLGRRVVEVASSLHGRGFILWAAALATGLVCVWQHVHSNELALEIEALRDAREAVRTEIGLLEMECAELSERKRIEEYAQERLGMRYPEAGEVIWLERSDSRSRAGGRDDYVMGGAARGIEG